MTTGAGPQRPWPISSFSTAWSCSARESTVSSFISAFKPILLAVAAITATARRIGLKAEINELTVLSRAEHDHAVENEDIGQGLCGPAPVVIQVYKFLALAEGERFGEEQRQTVEYKPVTEIAQQGPLHDSAGHERADRGDRRKDLRVARPEEDPPQAHEVKHQDDRHDRPDPPAEKANDVVLDVERSEEHT